MGYWLRGRLDGLEVRAEGGDRDVSSAGRQMLKESSPIHEKGHIFPCDVQTIGTARRKGTRCESDMRYRCRSLSVPMVLVKPLNIKFR